MPTGIEILENALNESNKQNTNSGTNEKASPEIKEGAAEGVKSQDDYKLPEEARPVSEQSAPEPKADVTHTEFKKGLSIFADIKKSTEEDQNIKDQPKGIMED